ncbi:MAG: DUF3772 domain-containing protein [Hyphomicrobiales bacterium]
MARTFSLLNSIMMVALVLFLAFQPTVILAQSADQELPPSVNHDQLIQGWRAQLDQISSAIKREGISDDELLGFKKDISEITDGAQNLSDELTPEIESLTSRLEKLNLAANATLVTSTDAKDEEQEATETEASEEAAQPSTTETPAASTIIEQPSAAAELSDSEIALNTEKAELESLILQMNAQLGRTQVILLRVDEISESINDLRRSKFTNELFHTSPLLISPTLWVQAISDTPNLITGLATILLSGLSRVWAEIPFLFLGSILLGALLSYGLLHHFKLLQLTERGDPQNDTRNRGVGYGQGINALLRIIRSLTLIVLTPGLVLLTITQAGVVAERLADLLWTLFASVAYFALARGLSLAIFSPKKPELRLTNIDDTRAVNLHKTAMVSLTIALIGFTLYEFAKILVASDGIVVFTLGLTSALFGASALLKYAMREKSDDPDQQFIPNVLVLKVLGIFVFISLVIALIAPILGFPNLGAFAVNQTILAGIISAIIYIVFRFIDALLGVEVDPTTGGVPIITSSNKRSQRRAQAKLLFSGFAKVLFTLLGVIVFAASWGLDTSSIWSDIGRLFKEVKIGELIISPATILTALLFLVLGILTTRALQRWFANRFLPTTNLDVGLRNSITTAIGYIGFIISAMIAFSQAGLDLSNLAIVAGALSLGIGFGLQSIVSNFVSGIILLAERPIKAGDWISVGGSEGTVKKISVRSTEIETFDRATVIMPNADFISGSVKNFMYGNTIGRFIVNVGVAYDSDPNHVKDILLECAKNHPLVLAYPESYVIFSDFGASSLDFELRGYLSDCGNGLSVRSDLRFAIFQRLKEEGIEIPFPQQDVYVKNLGDNSQATKSNAKPTQTTKSNAPIPASRPEPVTMRRDEIEDSGDADGR